LKILRINILKVLSPPACGSNPAEISAWKYSPEGYSGNPELSDCDLHYLARHSCKRLPRGVTLKTRVGHTHSSMSLCPQVNSCVITRRLDGKLHVGYANSAFNPRAKPTDILITDILLYIQWSEPNLTVELKLPRGLIYCTRG